MSGFLRSLFGRGRPPAPAAPPEPIFPEPYVHVSEPPPPLPPAAANGAATALAPETEAVADPDEAAEVAEALSAAAVAGEMDETLRLGARLRAAAPSDPAGYVLPARLLRDRGELDRADALLDSSASRPPDLLTMITRAEIAFARRDFAETHRRADALTVAFPDEALGYVLAAAALRELGRGAEAEQVMGRARERLPGDRLILEVWAETAAQRGDWVYAALRAAELRAAFPEHPAGWRIGVNALQQDGGAAKAEALMRQAAAVLPDAGGLLADWTRQALEAGDWPAARERAALLRGHAPADAEGYALGVRAMRGEGDLDAAKTLVAEAMAACGSDPSLLEAWADVAVDARDWPEVEEATSQLRAVCPDRWIGWFLGARALAEQGRDEAAEALLRTGREEFAPEPAIETLWTDLALRRGGWSEAVERAERIRALFPEVAGGTFLGVGALLGAGRLDEAAALAEEGVRRFPQDPVVSRLPEDVARARQAGPAPPAGASHAAGGPEQAGDVALAAALRDGRVDDAMRLWHASAEDDQSSFAELLHAALRITLADPWHEGARPLFETLGAEHSTHQPGWRPVVEHAPRLATSPEQFHDWREAAAAFLRGAEVGRLDPDTRARWLALVS